MSVTHRQSLSISSNGVNPISGSDTEVGTTETLIDQTFPAGSLNATLAAAFLQSALQSIVLLASQNVTLTTNGTNEVQQLATTGSVTAGTFTLTFSGQTTAAIAWNAIAAAVQSALVALSNIDTADVVCTGGPLPATPVIITFGGVLGLQNVAAITSTDTLTGGSTALSTTTAGVAPGNTFNLIAGNPLVWGRSAGYFANPFSADVTRFNVTCATSARLQAKVLVA